MNLTALPRSIARVPYAALRLPFTVLEERVVASHWGQGAPVRLGFEFSLGSLDRFAGWLLADEQISRRGKALMQRTGQSAEADAPETTAPVRPGRNLRVLPDLPADAYQSDEQDRDMAAQSPPARTRKTSAKLALRSVDG